MLSTFLIEYNVIYYISLLLSKFIKKNINLISIVILSMLSGFPSNSKYINDFYNEGLINKNDAEKLVGKTFFPSPMFVLGTVGTLYLNNYKCGLIILLSIYITNFILLFNFDIKNNTTLKRKTINSFGTTLSKSITNSISTLFIIMGSIILFSLFIKITSYYLKMPIFIETILNSILEMSFGTKKISTLLLSTNLKSIFISLTLTFGGLCIHNQMLSILPNDFNYKTIILERVKALIINLIIIIMLFSLSNICNTYMSISIITSS